MPSMKSVWPKLELIHENRIHTNLNKGDCSDKVFLFWVMGHPPKPWKNIDAKFPVKSKIETSIP